MGFRDTGYLVIWHVRIQRGIGGPTPPLPLKNHKNIGSLSNTEACIGVLGIQDISHFTSRDIGYYPFYFQGYGILCSIFPLLSGILII